MTSATAELILTISFLSLIYFFIIWALPFVINSWRKTFKKKDDKEEEN